jgi:hypothetical protein
VILSLSPRSAQELLDRLRRMADSPAVPVDALDRLALAWAVMVCAAEVDRIAAADGRQTCAGST